MIDIFPAFSLGGVALIKLMQRLNPPPIVRGPIVAGLMLSVVAYVFGRLHMILPDDVGLPLYCGLSVTFAAIIWWDWRDRRQSDRG